MHRFRRGHRVQYAPHNPGTLFTVIGHVLLNQRLTTINDCLQQLPLGRRRPVHEGRFRRAETSFQRLINSEVRFLDADGFKTRPRIFRSGGCRRRLDNLQRGYRSTDRVALRHRFETLHLPRRQYQLPTQMRLVGHQHGVVGQ